MKAQALLLTMLAVAINMPALGEELVIEAFDRVGNLRFNEITNAVGYRVEWAPHPGGEWSTNWHDLASIAPTGTGTVSVAVPMCYRVVALMSTEPVTNDYIKAQGTTRTYETSSGVVQGTSTNTFDGNDDSYYGIYMHHPGDGAADCWVRNDHEWVTPTHIDSVRAKMYARPYPHGNYEHQIYTFEIWFKLSGIWTREYQDHRDFNSSTPGYVGDENRDITLDAGWDNCSGVRVYVYAFGYSYEGDRQQEAWARIYEVDALAIQSP